MKLFEKVKNMFTEEVEEEVVVEQIPAKSKKENVPETVDSFEDVKAEKEEVKKPVFFTDHDFEDMEQKQNSRYEKEQSKFDYSSRNDYTSRNDYSVKKDYNSKNEYSSRSDYHSNYLDSKKETKIEAYQGNQTTVYDDPYKEKKEERVFKPTPIISPVYGILDKNYHKEDIVSKNDTDYKSIDGLSVDSIREKAYGSLEDELENTLFGSNSILFKDEKKKDDSKYDNFFDDIEEESKTNDTDLRDLENITMDIGKELDTLLNKDNNTNTNINNNKSINDNSDIEDDDLFNLIDTMYEGDEKYDD